MKQELLHDVRHVSARRLVVTVHGIRTFGGWQENLETLLNNKVSHDKIKILNYKYGYFSMIAFIIPLLRWLVVRKFRKELVAWCKAENWERIDLVGHSFGTHVLAWALHGIRDEDRPNIHTIILSGSVLRGSFPWRDLVGVCVKRVVNDCGSKDNVLIINQLFVLFTGMAGRAGFSGATHGYFRNRFFEFGHSGYFHDQNGRLGGNWMGRHWLPLFLSDDTVDAYDERKPPSVIDGFLQTFANNAEPFKLSLYIAPLLLIGVWIWGLYVGEAEALSEAKRQTQIAQDQTELADRRSALLSIDAATLARENGHIDEALLLLLDSSKQFTDADAPDKLRIEMQRSIDEAAANPRYLFGSGSRFLPTKDGAIVFDPRAKFVFRIRDFGSLEHLFSYEHEVTQAKLFDNDNKVTVIRADGHLEILDLETGAVVQTRAWPQGFAKLVTDNARALAMSKGRAVFETTIDSQNESRTDIVLVDVAGGGAVAKTLSDVVETIWFEDDKGDLFVFAPEIDEYYKFDANSGTFKQVSLTESGWEHRMLCSVRTPEISTEMLDFVEKNISWKYYIGNTCIEHRETSVLYNEFQSTSAGGENFYYLQNNSSNFEPVEILSGLSLPTSANAPFVGASLNGIDYWNDGSKFLVSSNRQVFIFDSERLIWWRKLPNTTSYARFVSENKVIFTLETDTGFEVRIVNLGSDSQFKRHVGQYEQATLAPANLGNCTGYTRVFDNEAETPD